MVEEIAPVGGAKPSVGNSRTARGQIHESVSVGRTGPASAPVRDEDGAGVERETITVGKRGGPALPESARKMLANIDKHGSVTDEPAAEAVAAPAAVSAPVETPTAVKADAVAPTPAAAAPATSTEDAAAEHKARADRVAEQNGKLVAELEQLRARPARGEPTPREKTLDEAERVLIDDSVGALRKLYMVALGVDDPKHPDIDQHLTWLYHDLTERELGVPLDPSIKNARELERIKHLRARDKREQAESQRPTAAPAVDTDTATKHGRVAELIGAGDHATKYPLLRSLATELHGVKPEELLWNEIHRGFQTGEYDRATQDTALIDLASRKIEDRYQTLGDKIAKARPAASTATPTQATVATDQKAGSQESGPRTITNASASVAPATPPAAKTATTDEPPKKPWRNEKERIKQLIAKHSGESTR